MTTSTDGRSGLAEETRRASVGALLDARSPSGIWEGELSTSALSTATAVSALALADRATNTTELEPLVRGGLEWLARNQNEDGGWGDTIDSPTNLSTTTLVWAAFGIDAALAAQYESTLERAEARLRRDVGELTPERLAAAIEKIYGDDRTFAVPILMNCALSGRFGAGREAWDTVRAIPFELAALPHQLFRWAGLPMVSYALPALIAVGQVIQHHRPTSNPLTGSLRRATRERTLATLAAIQPTTGGFLEATPLTSFVVMSLVGAECAEHAVVTGGLRFLCEAVRPDGSWPIDTNLTTWVTTLAVNALAGGGRLEQHLDEGERRTIAEWLAAQQYREEHPYTHAAPGGWAWTDLSGGVPDADDTAGALLALKQLGVGLGDGLLDAAGGCNWLVDLQNGDGGIPTFCRGWGKLPFDKSCPDLTAHALSAWRAWDRDLPEKLRQRVRLARVRAASHLAETQRADGAWVPLWFGNQEEPALENPLYGTTRVLKARRGGASEEWTAALARGTKWLLAAQNTDGGFGGAPGLTSSIEETALAVEALAECGEQVPAARALEWLSGATDAGSRFPTTPIGLYFARLWYSERLYPLIFTVSACERALR